MRRELSRDEYDERLAQRLAALLLAEWDRRANPEEPALARPDQKDKRERPAAR